MKYFLTFVFYNLLSSQIYLHEIMNFELIIFVFCFIFKTKSSSHVFVLSFSDYSQYCAEILFEKSQNVIYNFKAGPGKPFETSSVHAFISEAIGLFCFHSMKLYILLLVLCNIFLSTKSAFVELNCENKLLNL